MKKTCENCKFHSEDHVCKIPRHQWSYYGELEQWQPKEAPVEYKQLKPISAEVIIKFNPPKIEFIKFLNEWGINDDIVGIRDGAVAFNNFITHIKEYHPCWLPWFVKHLFIEKIEEEVFYHVGDNFSKDGIEYKLTIIRELLHKGHHRVQLINMKTGYNVVGGKIYDDEEPTITQSDFIDICKHKPDEFKVIK